MGRNERHDQGDADSGRGGENGPSLDLVLARYVDRINKGQRVEAAEVYAENPEAAAEILEQLKAFQEIDLEFQPDASLGTRALGKLGDYTLRRQIGRGGMGVVYEAWQNSMDRKVALKVLPKAVAADTRAVERFLREAQIAGKLAHPNIVTVHGIGIEDRVPWYAMEFVEGGETGGTLAQILARLRAAGQAPSPEECYRIAETFAGVSEGLQHAHEHKIIHRDLKPSNLILDREGRLRILDFGLARMEGQESLTQSGDLVGTPLYMSPEQARRKKIPIDHRTDIYSLGATLYEMLTLKPPFRGKDHQDTLSQIIERDPSPPSRINPRVPHDLETIALKCLRKDAADRYGTAEALAQDLRRFVRGDPIEARPQSGWERLLRRAWRHRMRGGALMGALLLLVTSGLLMRTYYRDVQRRTYEVYRQKVLGACVKLQMGQMVIRAQSGGPVSSDPPRAFTSGSSRATGDGGGLNPIQRALEEIEKAIRILPKEPAAYYHEAKAFLLLGRDEKAMKALDLAAHAENAFVPATVLRAVLLEKRGDQTGALREMERARTARDSSWAEAWHSAYTRAAEKRWEEAAEAYGKLI
ncbi:MAG: protein kinase [Planctomycetes bacterium]|nr:protein kinase [Planctomycetota bacterium]